jgi:uncharacterized membrane protein YhiD involved in acid resistance
VVLAAGIGLGLAAGAGLAQSGGVQMPANVPHQVLLPAVNRVPDANDRMEMQEKTVKKQKYDAANAERLRLMNKESDALLTMAMALKAEVDNSDKSGKLSTNAIRKADAIEILARGVKEKMKLTMPPN